MNTLLFESRAVVYNNMIKIRAYQVTRELHGLHKLKMMLRLLDSFIGPRLAVGSWSTNTASRPNDYDARQLTMACVYGSLTLLAFSSLD